LVSYRQEPIRLKHKAYLSSGTAGVSSYRQQYDPASKNLIVNTLTGVHEKQKSVALSFFPNPAADKIYLGEK